MSPQADGDEVHNANYPRRDVRQVATGMRQVATGRDRLAIMDFFQGSLNRSRGDCAPAML